jgi:hypothetical protein
MPRPSDVYALAGQAEEAPSLVRHARKALRWVTTSLESLMLANQGQRPQGHLDQDLEGVEKLRELSFRFMLYSCSSHPGYPLDGQQ